ncbi:MAG: stage V sporulation protein AD [Clostridia bacterium]|nr:stage V sporulation protein AD [Clostridia bacterium]
MNRKIGKQTYELENKPVIIASGAFVGGKEAVGPFSNYFENIAVSDMMGEKTFEKAERRFFESALSSTLKDSNLHSSDLDYMVGGDILNQLVSANYTARDFQIPFVGVYGACSTMAESLAISAGLISSGIGSMVACLTGSHFSSAERQYRNPLEFGNQRPTYSQWTATGAGCCILSRSGKGPVISKIAFGKVTDYGVVDIANMGAAMAPAAYETLKSFFEDTKTGPDDYDLIATGDLGKLGSDVLRDLLQRDKIVLGKNYMDCGHSLFREEQKTFQGGSGAGCSAIVFSTYIMNKLKSKVFNKVLLVATGALMSTITNQQGDSIPCVAHLVEIDNV